MSKKLMLAAVLMFTAVSLFAAPKVRIYQYSEKALVESLLRVCKAGDVDGFVELQVPGGYRKTFAMMMEYYGVGLHKFVPVLDGLLAKTVGADDAAEILRSTALVEKLKNTLSRDGNIVKVGGKYYFYFAIPTMNDRKSVAVSMLAAVACNDGRTMFEIYTPATQQEMIKECGSKENAIQAIENEFKKGKQTNITVDELKNEDIVKEISDGLVQIGGKWYFDTEK